MNEEEGGHESALPQPAPRRPDADDLAPARLAWGWITTASPVRRRLNWSGWTRKSRWRVRVPSPLGRPRPWPSTRWVVAQAGSVPAIRARRSAESGSPMRWATVNATLESTCSVSVSAAPSAARAGRRGSGCRGRAERRRERARAKSRETCSADERGELVDQDEAAGAGRPGGSAVRPTRSMTSAAPSSLEASG